MTEKALISEFTYRTLESQKAAFVGMPIFILPDDLSQLFRQTTRKGTDRLHVVSLGIIADREKDFRDFLELARKKKAEIVTKEDDCVFKINGNIENLVRWWRDARRSGSVKAGASLGAAKRRAASEERAKGLTKEEWLNSEVTNAQLVEKYGCAIRTLRRIASDKGWGWNRQHAIWRAEQKKGRKLQLPIKKGKK